MSDTILLVVAFVIGWLAEPLVTRFDPFWPPAYLEDNNEQ